MPHRGGGGWKGGMERGGVKKTSPIKGKVFFTGNIQIYIHTDGHHNSMTESAQWADSVKSTNLLPFWPVIRHNICLSVSVLGASKSLVTHFKTTYY